MKKSALLLLTVFSLSVSAQTKTSTSKSDTKQTVKDDGKTLHLTISSNQNGKKIAYDHTFKVAGLSKKQKDALVKNVTDSLGIVPPPATPPPHKMGK
ncbi:MAG: hypothetical protein EOP42_28505 [Sphingobacteriaceae bacterium]|nr:MAG: hypothetical protein EOP42_28505 [Sphingobacteriaceae bacterium]